MVYRIFYVTLYVMKKHRVIYRMSLSRSRDQRCPRCHPALPVSLNTLHLTQLHLTQPHLTQLSPPLHNKKSHPFIHIPGWPINICPNTGLLFCGLLLLFLSRSLFFLGILDFLSFRNNLSLNFNGFLSCSSRSLGFFVEHDDTRS